MNITKTMLCAALGLALAALLAVPSTGARAQETDQELSEGDMIQANLENIQLGDFIRFVASYTGRNIVFQEAKIPKTTVTIFSSQTMSEPELMAVFEQVLNSANLYAVARGNVLYILDQKEATALESGLEKKTAGTEDELVTTVYRLKPGISPQLAGQLMSKFSSSYGQVQPIPQAGSIMIRDRRDRVAKMQDILEIFQEVKPNWKTSVLPLNKAKAADAAGKLTAFYKELTDRGQMGDVPLVTPVEWTNSLLVAGTPSQIRTVKGLLAEIDMESDAADQYIIKVYKLQNAKAGSAAEVLQSLADTVTDEEGVTSPNNKVSYGEEEFMVSADEDTNSIVVMAKSDFLARVDEIVAQLDQPLDQVYIEALIMETQLTNSREFGVEWMGGGGSGRSYVGSVGFINNPNSNLLGYADPVIDGGNAPDIASMPGGFSMGILGNIIKYGDTYFPSIGAMINFAKGVSDFNLISAPQIMTLDNSEAEIFVGQNRPFKTGQSQNTGGEAIVTTYDYRDVGIKLNVTPHINREKRLIRMDIVQEFKGVTNDNLELPITLDRNTKTSVQLVDGSTMIISGLIDNQISRQQSGVPGLSDLPLLGWLFKSRGTSADKKTLMVFISAKIIDTQEFAEALSQEKFLKLKKEREQINRVIEREFGIEPKKAREPSVQPQAVEPGMDDQAAEG